MSVYFGYIPVVKGVASNHVQKMLNQLGPDVVIQAKEQRDDKTLSSAPTGTSHPHQSATR